MGINTPSSYEGKVQGISVIPKEGALAIGRAVGESAEHAMVGVITTTREAINGVVGTGAHLVDGTVGVAVETVGNATVRTVGGTIEGAKAIGSAGVGLVATPVDYAVTNVKNSIADMKKGPAEAFVGGMKLVAGTPAMALWGGAVGGWNLTKKTFTHTLWRPIKGTVVLGKEAVVGVASGAWNASKTLVKAPFKMVGALGSSLFSALSAPLHHGGEFVHKVRQELPAYRSPGESYKYSPVDAPRSTGGGGFIKRFSAKK